MSIGLVVPGFSANTDDWCIPALRHLARTLAADDEVRVIAVRYPYARGRYRIDGAETIALGGALSHGRETLLLWRNALQLLHAEHRRRPFDVLHAVWATESGLLAALAGRLLGVPTLVSLAGGELVALRDIGYGDQRLAGERLKVAASLRLASGVSAGSRLLVDLAHQHLPAGRRAHLAPLGVDTERFTPALSESAPPGHLLHVASLTRVKDQATLLRAFAVLRREGACATLEIVGDGPLRAELMRLVHELQLDGSVCFRGEVDHSALPDVYRGAQLFVLSSRHEAQSMVVLEAAACGAPVAGTCVGILPELTSAVAPVAEPAKLAQAIKAALEAGPSRQILDRVGSDYSLRACADRFRQLYVDLM